jgi:glutamine synthetase
VVSADRATILSALDRVDVQAQLQARGVDPAEVKGRVAALTDEEAARTGAVRLPADQASALDALDASDRARRLLGEELLEALTAVRRYELDTYGGQDVASVAEKLRYAWSA